MILAINTSTVQFSLALLSESGGLVAEHLMSEGKGHFGSLMPTLHFLLNSSEREIREVKCISVATGPGSFTGLRIGLSLSKGLCQALRVPIVGISTLEAMAVQAPCAGLPVVPILHSRKGEVFTARFIWENERGLKRAGEDTWVRFDDAPLLFQEPSLFVGNDYPTQGTRLKDLLGERALLAPLHCWSLRASAVGSLALERFLQGDLDDPCALNPVYLRPPDIRPNPSLKSRVR
jgi:tRNA threonylcarbamoyladenosine biosynthesis protein TsaB